MNSTARQRWTRVVAGAAAALLLVGACSSSDDETTTDTTAADTTDQSTGTDDTTPDTGGETAAGDDLLGPINEASGEAVPVGVISDGRFATGDSTIELTVAEAAIEFVNERRAGIGGRPIEAVTCETGGDPAAATDCANQMIDAGVVAVLIGQSQVMMDIWTPLHDAGIPTFLSIASGDINQDTESSFSMSDSSISTADPALQVALDNDLDKVTLLIVDIPAALDQYTTIEDVYGEEGVEVEFVRAPLGTADLTPQLQSVASDAGVVYMVGNDAFCIAGYQALSSLGFDGPIVAIPQCFSDATREAIPAEQLEGTVVPAPIPLGIEDESTALFRAFVDAYAPDTDTSIIGGALSFTLVTGFALSLEGITGDITPASVIATAKAMPDQLLPGGGGLHFRCNGNASSTRPASCVRGQLLSTLGPDGFPTGYEPGSEEPIED